MQVGDKIEISGQMFKCVDYSPYITRNGREVIYLVMRGRCADCRVSFSFITSRTSLAGGSIIRRCKLHRDPGRRVDHRRSVKRAEAHQAAMARVRMQMRRLRDAHWLN
jgi:hypothetical protein